MKIEYYKNWSQNLNQDMELKVYGHAGKPAVVFPTQCGRFYDYEDNGMIGTASWFIEEGFYQFFTVDSVDWQTWVHPTAHPADRARRHEDYDQYITQEVVPWIHAYQGTENLMLTTGCSMGGYHSSNFFFRHPDIFDSLISLSGILKLNMFIGDYMDELVYFNTPLAYLKNLDDEWYLEKYRRSKIIICSGQGAWEDEMQSDARELANILEAKNVPAWVDLWGHDVNHDWPWWHKQLPYFLSKLLEE